MPKSKKKQEKGKKCWALKLMGSSNCPKAYSISFDNNLVPEGLKKGTAKTVSVKVFLKGNETTSPNATLKLKISIK